MASKLHLNQRTFALKLYKAIMRTHHRLPPAMKYIGDGYVRQEFKLHKTAKPEHLGPFFSSWLEYLKTLTESPLAAGDLGRKMSEEDIVAMSEQQLEQLQLLKGEAARLIEIETEKQHNE